MSDAFLIELRQDCLKDPDGVIPAIEEAIGKLRAEPANSLKNVMKGLHTLKGNLQAVGLSHCARFVHDLESGIDRVNQALARTAPSESDLSMLEFLLSDAMTTLKEYFEFLARDPASSDTEAALTARLMPIELINHWTPDGNDSGQVEVVTEPADQEQAPETQADPLQASQAVLHEVQNDSQAQPPTAPSPERPEIAASDKPVARAPEATAAVARPTEKAASPERASYLLCAKTNSSGQQSRFAIPVKYITEVVKASPLSPLPGAHERVVGLMNLRGEPVPICTMPDFPRDSLTPRGNQYVALVRVQSDSFGIVVDAADEIQVLDPSGFQKPESLTTDPKRETWLRHLTKIEGQTIMIFDLEAA